MKVRVMGSNKQYFLIFMKQMFSCLKQFHGYSFNKLTETNIEEIYLEI